MAQTGFSSSTGTLPGRVHLVQFPSSDRPDLESRIDCFFSTPTDHFPSRMGVHCVSQAAATLGYFWASRFQISRWAWARSRILPPAGKCGLRCVWRREASVCDLQAVGTRRSGTASRASPRVRGFAAGSRPLASFRMDSRACENAIGNPVPMHFAHDSSSAAHVSLGQSLRAGSGANELAAMHDPAEKET